MTETLESMVQELVTKESEARLLRAKITIELQRKEIAEAWSGLMMIPQDHIKSVDWMKWRGEWLQRNKATPDT